MDTPRRNIELKATDPDQARSVALCRELGAVEQGTLRQCDSYFAVTSGALKLREESPGQAHLIQYERADQAGGRESRYRVVPVAQAAELKAALTAALGLTVVVSKHRRLFLWAAVRIHLDTVEGLGTFIELEAVAPPSSDLRHEHGMIEQLRARFGIGEQRLLTQGYAAQLEALRAGSSLNLEAITMHVRCYDEIDPFTTLDGSEIREWAGPVSAPAKNQSLAEATVPLGGATTAHYHRLSEELYLITAGRGLLMMDGEERVLQEGDCALIPPGAVHKIFNVGQGPLRIVCACSPAYSDDDTVLTE